MIDWASSMQQTFEFYEVDPDSWLDKKKLTNITKCTISRDLEAETLGSATFDVVDSVGECYIRVYLIATQGNDREKIPLGTFLVQTPSSTFDGKSRTVSMDAYTPLIELKEDKPPIGHWVNKGEDIIWQAFTTLEKHARAPVVGWPYRTITDANNNTTRVPVIESTKLSYTITADSDDTWLTFVSDLLTGVFGQTAYRVQQQDDGSFKRTIETIANTQNGFDLFTDGVKIMETVNDQLEAVKTTDENEVYSDGNDGYYCIIQNNEKYRLGLDSLGRICFETDKDVSMVSPIWTYSDDNSSILYSDLSMDHDLYEIPNVVEVLCSDGNITYHSVATNDNPNSPTSTITRGRTILHRVTDPDIYGTPTQERIDKYAQKLLEELSSVEYKITYTHGYCPVNIGDCVRMDYKRAGLTNIKAKVISQSISCEPGCPVSETAVFTANLLE